MLYFENVSIISYSHTPIQLDAGLRYKVEKRITINGVLRDNSNPAGVNKIITKEKAILDGATDYDDIQLNGISFGSGYITKINFAGGEMVSNEKYNYEIICYEIGNLFNATNGVYAGITWSNANLIENIDEKFDYEEDQEGNKTYNHHIEVQYISSNNVTSNINLAKALATEFFNATSGLGAFINSYSGLNNVKRIYIESYDAISAKCNFNESINIPANSSGHYSYNINYNLDQGSDGYINVTEVIEIQGLTNPKYAGAVEGIGILKVNAYSRSNVVYTAYNWSDAALYSLPIEQGENINKFTGQITFKSVFTNNPKYQNFAIWNYIQELDLDENNYYTVSERGNIVGFGRPTLDKYKNAINFYNTNIKSPAVDGRLATFYAKSGRANTLYLKSQSINKNEFAGSITYSISKTDNNTFNTTNIKSSIISVETTQPVHLVKNYNIFNYKEITQTQNQSTLGQVRISINLKGIRGLTLPTFLTEAKNIAITYIPSFTNQFIDKVDYAWNPQNNNLSFNIIYIFANGYKNRDDLTIDLPS